MRSVLGLLLCAAGLSHAATAVDIDRFEAYLDGLVAAQFRDYKLAGMTFVLVDANGIRLRKGYGVADVSTQEPVDPQRHLFRPGSVSKLITWTAVMQLVEQGKLDLDAPAQRYVEQFELPNAFDVPLTLTHLLTHTPGLEDGAAGYLFADEASELKPLATVLETYKPKQVRAPGTYSAYSNWATALAGLIVANVSGQPFEDYVREHIFEPLGMTQATFDEPLPARLQADMTTGYVEEDGALVEFPFEFIKNFGPAGAMSASADALGLFMLAHLNGGAYAGGRILAPETVRRMHSRLFGHHDAVDGMAHGFIEYRRNGQRFVGHGGDTVAFHSQLLLDPENGFGFYLSFNAADGVRARAALVDGVIDYFYPATSAATTTAAATSPGAASAERLAQVAGAYRINRRSYTKLEGILSLAADVQVVELDNGAIALGLQGQTSQFREVSPYVFEQVGRQERLVFDTSDGPIRLYIGSVPIVVADKVSTLTAASTHQLVIALALLAALFVIINAVRNRGQALAGAALWGRRAVFVTALFLLAGFVVFGVVLAGFDMNQAIFDFPVPGVGVALGLWLLGALGTVASAALLPGVWLAPECSGWARWRYTWVVLVFLALVAVLWYWNLLGWNYY